MFEQKKLSSYADGEALSGFYIISNANKQSTKNGKPYWRVDLKDEDGRMAAKIWNNCPDFPEAFPDLSQEIFAEVKGTVSLYSSQLQCVIDRLRILNESENSEMKNKFKEETQARTSALRTEKLDELEQLSQKILTNTAWKDFFQTVVSNEEVNINFPIASAARNFHHAYAGGLLEHSLSVAKLCMTLCDLYPELDRQCLFAAAIFHDIGKIREMKTELTTEYTDEGLLLGHIVEGLCILNPFLEKSSLSKDQILHIRHLIASHHGNTEFGSPKIPQTEEAYVLHFADDLDAKLNRCRTLVPPGSETIIHAGNNNFTAFRFPTTIQMNEKTTLSTESHDLCCTVEEIPYSIESEEGYLTKNVPQEILDDIPMDFYETVSEADIPPDDEQPWCSEYYDMTNENIAVSEKANAVEEKEVSSKEKNTSRKKKEMMIQNQEENSEDAVKKQENKKMSSQVEPIQGSLF